LALGYDAAHFIEHSIGIRVSVADPFRSNSRVDRWLSMAAAVGAVCAVAIAVYQAALARQQQRASAWPFLAQSNSYLNGQQYTRQIENQGVGPARVRSFQVLVDGKPAHTWSDVVRALVNQPDSGLTYSSFGRGGVVPAGAARVLLTLPPGNQARSVWEAAQTRLATIVCYCSVYDECWSADTRAKEPVAVRACAENSTSEFAP
jgi:hypothetical protein